MQLLVEHAWPGNIRELENLVKRTVVMGSAEQIRRDLANVAVPAATPVAGAAASVATVTGTTDARIDLKAIARQAARDAERIVIAETLERVRWNRVKAARLLQISYKALLYKIVDCGLASKTDVAEPEVRVA
jgi:two-component system, NtrC family, response regulator AtoC